MPAKYFKRSLVSSWPAVSENNYWRPEIKGNKLRLKIKIGNGDKSRHNYWAACLLIFCLLRAAAPFLFLVFTSAIFEPQPPAKEIKSGQLQKPNH